MVEILVGRILGMDVAALGALAGGALVQAMVTDGWQGVRQSVARLFGRGDADSRIERRLNATREQLTAAAAGELNQVQAALAGQWETRFADLLADYPDAEADLADLVAELRAAAPVAVGDHSVTAGRDVRISADGGSVAAGVIHGGVMPPDPLVAGPARD
jgi:hypothetical protein